MKRRLWLVLSITLFLALACNLPAAPQGVEWGAEKTRSAEQTLVAELFPEPPTPALPVKSTPPASGAVWEGLATAVPGSVAGAPAPLAAEQPWVYFTQSGDTLPALAARFGVSPQDVAAAAPLPPQDLLTPGQKLVIPNMLESGVYSGALLPDSEIVFSPSAADFDIEGYVSQAGGYLSRYVEQIDNEEFSGAEIIQRVAVENSINPRLLLAVLEYRSGWVAQLSPVSASSEFPIGFYAPSHTGLYRELLLTARQLTIGYYGWRSGGKTTLAFKEPLVVRIDPRLNAGSAAVQYLFSVLYPEPQWRTALYGESNFALFYEALFGDPWARAAAVEPLLPPGLTPPALELPFLPGRAWSLTGGPHAAWGVGSPWGAVDFAPVEDQKGCFVAQSWATAAASGRVVRSAHGVVALDLDGDGLEQTGWVLVYLHLAARGRAAVGDVAQIDDPIGHPSCEGGVSTGTHVHLTRKYNGEWIGAGDPLPYVLSGWRVIPAEKPYLGVLVREGIAVSARSDGSGASSITR